MQRGFYSQSRYKVAATQMLGAWCLLFGVGRVGATLCSEGFILSRDIKSLLRRCLMLGAWCLLFVVCCLVLVV
ncbi:hypothetical protein [Pseudoalteromonas maricaloris]|uniref:hypothetical protein n=1 Tax=Pseudoalteromonas maricaloris TaxID=184924 RepID=UPI00057DEC00|nr:hypothetical protein [Pseudoalteromonas flavipulchra]KID36116.1 hypothetical protein QT15_10850 [Pseudoalteromonas flavipulchra NCIMB 2033 = ATCC BAA-314]MBD0780283.1 hypothetical protein [Pseudoalteromonas flavipulchra]